MSLLQLRPTFQIPLSESRQHAIVKLETEFSRSGKRDNFLMHGEYGELHLPAAEHRLWSPHLSFYIADYAAERDGQALIHGRFAPRLEVWTFVWVIYLAMSFTAFFGLTLAYSQWMLGESGWGQWVAIVAVLTIIVLYVVANIGQQLSADQMSTLRNRLDGILQEAGVPLTSDTVQREAIAAADQPKVETMLGR